MQEPLPNDAAAKRLADAVAESVTANAVEFTDEQRSALRDGFFEAESALLQAITKQAGSMSNFEAPRNLAGLIGALQGLRGMSGQSPHALWGLTHGPGGWFGYAPGTGGMWVDDELMDG